MSRYFLLLTVVQLVISCAPFSQVQEASDLLAYIPQTSEQSLLSRFHPIFLVEEKNYLFNRIGTPKAVRLNNGKERVYVDPEKPTVYVEKRYFNTTTASYMNLIYRIHFAETPFSLFPFQIGMGKNVGLIVIITLDSSEKPVLYTTVHTCGCYLAFIPTTHLHQKALPKSWPKEKQVVFSEVLPSMLELKDNQDRITSLMILLRTASHRVMDIWLEEKNALSCYETDYIQLKSLSSLEKLTLNESNGTTSLYESSVKQNGFVRNNSKPIERLLMSWWTFDWYIGEDKRLGYDKSEPPVFYTSLKPWARDASDMRDFATFLKYWGWNL